MDSPYLLIPVILISSFLYVLTFLLVKTGILPKSIHKKIWNLILLVTFVVTAMLGLLLAIQINYKLEWPIIKAILKWHVDFGIGLSFVASVHLIWHFKYYVDLFSIKSRVEPIGQNNDRNYLEPIRYLSLFILLSGFIATVIQVLLLREITTIFQGNELMLAWTLGIWMLLTGIGTLLGRKSKIIKNNKNLIQNILIILAIIPFINATVIMVFRNMIFPPGLLVHPGWFILIVFFLFAPVCLCIGCLFSLFVRILQKNDNGYIKVYGIETIGSMLGGLIVSLLFIWYLNIFESIIIASVIIFLTLYFTSKKSKYLSGIAAFIILFAIFQIFQVNRILYGFLFSHQKVTDSRETWHGNVTVTENSGQFNVHENGSLLFTSDNKILSEEYVHYAMLQRIKPRQVLLISGGMAGMLKEISKYSCVEKIDYLEPNSQLVSIVSKYLPLYKDKRIHLIKGDTRRFLKNTKENYDVVIMAIPDPSSLQVDRLYTSEFIKLLRNKLNSGGIILYGISPAGNYLSAEKTRMEAAMYHNLQQYFKYIGLIPGEKDYYIASDSAISLRIAVLSKSMDTTNAYVNPYYMDDNSITERSRSILAGIKDLPVINTDDKPRVVFTHYMQFLSMFGNSGRFIMFILFLLLLIPLLFMKSPARSMFIAGFTASTVEIILIFIFQLIFGYLYSAIGVMIATFMAGLAIGSFASGKIKDTNRVKIYACLLLAVSVAIIPLCYSLMNQSGNILSIFILLFLILIPSSIVGFLFALYSRVEINKNYNYPSIIYASDLFGSALGIIAVTVLLLPLFGISVTCYLVAGLNIFPVFFNLKKLK